TDQFGRFPDAASFRFSNLWIDRPPNLDGRPDFRAGRRSEENLRRDLNNPREVLLVLRQLAERGAGDAGGGSAVQRVVEQIERLSTQAELEALRDGERLG